MQAVIRKNFRHGQRDPELDNSGSICYYVNSFKDWVVTQGGKTRFSRNKAYFYAAENLVFLYHRKFLSVWKVPVM